MKKEITEYEPAEEKTTRIQCGSCDQRWDDRSDSGVNTVVLDCQLNERSGYSRSRWRDKRFDRRLHGDDRLKLTGESVEDYCDSCWDGFFEDSHATEVTESEFYVEEETREEYYCDLCGNCMGESADFEVSVNPRIELTPRIEAGMRSGRDERDVSVLTNELDDTVSGHTSRDKVSAERDSVEDCCGSCAREIFRTKQNDSSNSRGLLARLLGM